MEVIKPKKLKVGDTIGIVAPSSHCPPEDSAAAVKELEKLGFNVFLHPQCLARDHMSAGTPQAKAAALHDVFADKSIDAVFCLRGGYQTLNILDLIDYNLIRKNPKILIGYSDITALHGAFYHRAGLGGFHGTTARIFKSLAEPGQVDENANSLNTLEFLKGNIPDNLMRDASARTLNPGTAEGHIIGGNIQLLSALMESGEKYTPSFDKAILIIEDIAEEITKIERQLCAWRLRGVFKNLAGLVVGYMTDIRDTPGSAGKFFYDMEAVIRRHSSEMKGPVIMNAPFGHELPNYPFPIGTRARLTAPEKGAPQLQLLESPFSDA